MSEKIVQLNEKAIKEVIRGRVGKILNEFLEVKAEKLTQAALEDTSIAG